MADYIDRTPFPVLRPGERFVYEGRTGFGGGDARTLEPVEMTIQSGDGGEWLDADIEVTLTRGGNVTTVTDEDAAMMFTPELSSMTNGRTWIWLYRFNLVTDTEPRISSLEVGDTWSYDTQSDENQPPSGLDFEVSRTGSYAGVDCMNVVTETYTGDDRWVLWETCVAPDVGLPVNFVLYDDEGNVMLELELTEYSR